MSLNILIRTAFDKKYAFAWKVIFWTNSFLLLYLTLSPDVHHRPTFSNVDKVYHFIGFAAFAFFLSLAYPRLKAPFVLVISVLLGLAVEIAQHYIPYRSASLGDLLADMAGAATAITVVIFLRKL